MLNVGGLTAFTTIDYPGALAAVVFCQGCPWRCGYCHNRHLRESAAGGIVPWDDVLAFLRRRRGLLDAVVFSGGEPTLQPGLADAVRAVKDLGYKAGLHTAGPYPERLSEVLSCLDWVGMDIKAPFEEYEAVTAVRGSGEAARESAQRLRRSGVRHGFRIPLDPLLMENGRLDRLKRMMAEWGSEFVLQPLTGQNDSARLDRKGAIAMAVRAACLGYPRIGIGRELKKALEAFWAGKIPAEELRSAAATLRRGNWSSMKTAGIDHVPGNDFSLYDHVLDMAVAVGAVPERYRAVKDPLSRYFAMARGLQDPAAGIDVAALDMTKWFDTNYHYIVPELEEGQLFKLDASKILAEVEEARSLGIEIRPVILGPVTFLMLSRFGPEASAAAVPLDLLGALLPVYEELLGALAARGVSWVQVDEPCLVLDLDRHATETYRVALRRLAACASRPRLMIATYFGSVAHNLPLFVESGCDALHIDLVRAPEQLDVVLNGLSSGASLSLGVVDGRNIWRTDLDAAHSLVRRAFKALGENRLFVAPSCSLLHAPIDLAAEKGIDPELKSWLAFASRKVAEVRALADAAKDDVPVGPLFDEARTALTGRRASPRTRNPKVRDRAAAVDETMLRRISPFEQRIEQQRARFGLPPLPTTTIGSFPQTAEIRQARAKRRKGAMSEEEYERFLRDEMRKCVSIQERLGLDVLVHGEFERNDMVEFFGEQLEGFAFTENGWVQSYGSRCVKPPVLYGDVSRRGPMTVGWTQYAASLTRRPMKGILTGPVTILQWSFVRDDQPRRETCRQVALALRDEVADLEAAGIGMIQVDEPAIREGLPLRVGDRPAYLRWAVGAFRLATSGVRDDTQIHTHLCYSEFGDILDAIVEMDADVLSIESSRSGMALLSDFSRCRYPNEVGPGVYDIHSPRVPSREEMEALIAKAAEALPAGHLWVNPDCGLKTRGWPEVEASLGNMVEAARRARAERGRS